MGRGTIVKRAKFNGPTIVGWMWIAFGLLILILIGSFISYYWHNQRIDSEAENLGQKIDMLYDDYASIASTYLSFQGNAEDSSSNIYEMHQLIIDSSPADPTALVKLEATMNMRSNLDKMSAAVASYMTIRDPDLLEQMEIQIQSAQTDFDEAYTTYENIASGAEKALLNVIYGDFEELTADSITIRALTDSLYESLTQFEPSSQELDTYPAGPVLDSIQAEVLAAQEDLESLSSSANRWFIALIVTAILVGIVAFFLVSRKITGPVTDLIKGATIVESGRINHRFNIDAKGELGQLAVSLNKMLNNLERIHKALEHSEEQAWALLDVSNDTVILMDTRGAILASNEIAAEKFGMSLEQMINESLYGLLPPESAVSLKAHVNDAMLLKRPVHYEDEQEGKVIDRNILPMLDPKGEVNRIAIFSRDVTVHKWVEDVTVQYGRRYERILQAAGEGIFGLDTQGITTFVNPVAARMLGYDPDELIGKRHHELVHYTKPDGTPYPSKQCPIHAAFKDGTVHTNIDNEVFWRKDGTCFPVEYTSTPIVEGDKILGAVITFRDISDRK